MMEKTAETAPQWLALFSLLYRADVELGLQTKRSLQPWTQVLELRFNPNPGWRGNPGGGASCEELELSSGPWLVSQCFHRAAAGQEPRFHISQTVVSVFVVVVSEWKAKGKREVGGGEVGKTGWREKEERVVFRALCKTSNRSSLARSVDVRVVGPLGQMASHIASHMVGISPHCLRPSPNWQERLLCLSFFPFFSLRPWKAKSLTAATPCKGLELRFNQIS
ncbi:hypothetical protein JOQ06_029058, partial [Pogonophryne albipinna]